MKPEHLEIELKDWAVNVDLDKRISACRLIKKLVLQKYLNPEKRIDPMIIVLWFFHLRRSFPNQYKTHYTSKGIVLRHSGSSRR